MPLEDAAPERFAWRIEMLGSLRAVPVDLQGRGNDAGQAGDSVEQFRTHKAALLLARLALFPNRSHAREELADLLWPDAPTERGRASLTQTLVYLRQALHEPRTGGLLNADHRTVRMARPLLQTDVSDWEAEAARALAATSDPEQSVLVKVALAAYRGDLLPGFYDDWVCQERNRLATLRDALQECLLTISAASKPVQVPQPKVEVARDCDPETPAMGNAPLYLTRFFGRESECARASELLCQNPPVRLLTLLGMGGIGKTRLALEIADAALKDRAGDGRGQARFSWATFVPLADAQTVEYMEGTLLHVLGIQGGGADGLAAITERLNAHAARRAGRLLLVLDNLEQLGEVAAPVVARLLTGVPALTILATSRQPVGIAGEWEIPIGSLPGTARGTAGSIPEDRQLFADRARLVRPEFALLPDNETAVVELCALLEGVPLALELAAAWARVLTPSQIAARLGNRFDLLALRGVSTAGGIPKRHRSLHAAIAWSYDLLGPSLQAFFAQLSVFRGGWTAEAAQAITEVGDVSEPLLLLAERSLILVEESTTGEQRQTRYRMLESLREFADEQLDRTERESLVRRHAHYFEDLSREADRPDARQGARACLRPERDNLRAAIVSGLRQEGRVSDDGEGDALRDHGIQILFHTSWIWTVRETDRLCVLVTAVLPQMAEKTRGPVEAHLLLMQGSNALLGGDYAQAIRCLEASLGVCEAFDLPAVTVKVKGRLANLAIANGERAKAIAAWWDCLRDARRLGDKRQEAAMLNNLAIASPDLAKRRSFSEQAVAIDRIYAPHSYFLAASLNTMANAAREQADFATAQSCLEEAFDLARADGSVGTVALIQTSLVELFLETGEHLDRAHDLLCASQFALEEYGELPAIADTIGLRFRLALALGDADEAVALTREYLRLAGQIKLDAEAVTARRLSMADQLRQAGFPAHAERLLTITVD